MTANGDPYPNPVLPSGPLPHWLTWAESGWFLAATALLLAVAVVGLILRQHAPRPPVATNEGGPDGH
ncbi:hypothetical protein EDD99_8102 [Streptomyces sp. 846.5]|nr:hypothetical protein [Streptomyces sp. 846.5]TDT93293.1 hypothetical protein EDD99_8102 [Streptomyces sp. 846.5]